MQKAILDGTTYEIPIGYFETDMNTESSKDKKERILDLFRNHNKLKSEEEFNEIESQLYYACIKGDLELIKILLSETIEDDSKNFLIKIDKTNKTASFYKYNKNSPDLIIPRTVKHKNDDYLVTSICGLHCISLKIKFEEESAVSTIYGCAFPGTDIEEIFIPKSLIELKEGWCIGIKKLTRIIISPSNGQFKFEEGKYLIGKSNQNDTEFDKLLFVRRDIKEVSIPASVTKICEFAFSDCNNLRKVEIPTNSFLQTIEEFAFSDSDIEEIYFPKSLIELKEGWCFGTKNLRRITISPLNGQFIFKEDKYLIGKSNQNDDEFDKLLFVRRDIKEISIPASVTKICEFAFSCCRNLRKVEIPTNSRLQTIEKYAFWESNIEEISIPASVTKICEGAFSDCRNLIKVEITTNSNLQTIEKDAFSLSKIKEIFIPRSVTKICEKAFYGCYNLRKVEIPTNSNLQTIEGYAFSSSKIEGFSIPASVTKICERAFFYCFNLRKVEIPTNSNLQTIEKDAFSSSKIEEISIPASVTKICEKAFSFCSELQIVEISEESQIQSISKSSFKNCQEHMIIMIPSSLKELIKLINY